MAVIPFQATTPTIDGTSFVAPDAWVIGNCTVGPRVSIFFGAVLRGDIHPITVGEGSNIQEHSLLHTSHEFGPVTVGANVTIGHRAIIHGATIHDESLVGMGATVLDDAVVGTHCIVGAHTLIPKGMVIPARSLVVGTPAKIIREVSDEEISFLRKSAERYQQLGAVYSQSI
jgi:carbonic anhydrase/acetyltransferase-like protein (isoleucine patch superfamily)